MNRPFGAMTLLWRIDMKTSKTTLTLALTVAIGAAAGVANIAYAAGNPLRHAKPGQRLRGGRRRQQDEKRQMRR